MTLVARRAGDWRADAHTTLAGPRQQTLVASVASRPGRSRWVRAQAGRRVAGAGDMTLVKRFTRDVATGVAHELAPAADANGTGRADVPAAPTVQVVARCADAPRGTLVESARTVAMAVGANPARRACVAARAAVPCIAGCVHATGSLPAVLTPALRGGTVRSLGDGWNKRRHRAGSDGTQDAPTGAWRGECSGKRLKPLFRPAQAVPLRAQYVDEFRAR